ncbi:hypothetical protein FB192DRAFT_1281841 [Mucor lusitanicus]|uniref:3'-5' exonuclease domain-containing protein n=1 Tax=Mucor circinelloides f. lusitanicus TaxID=29924 RepID=A0A8H4BGB8_MUCCL|nr:hypothetical protein FB192DRAFT_1281841 [Mucor lusitanicus]
MTQMEISKQGYWRSTHKSAEALLSLLSVFEKRNVKGVDKAIESLRDIVPLSNHKNAICMFVSNEQQLDEAIQDIHKADYIAIDCEFQSVKKSLPELKLIQIGVSSTKGFAIQVDAVGFDVLSAKLKPILEDDNVNIVGWSYRPDAMAIESYFKSIRQAPVLDLQAKLMPIAVETMNLETAMVRFADQWDGLEAFRKAKHYNEGFFYKDDDCIWARNPLPPKALVYSVFDVLSVHALHHYTTQYPSEEKFYWPCTVTNQSEKALNRFHQQRAQGIASPASASSVKNGKSPAAPKTHWNTNYKSTSPTYRHRNNNNKHRRDKEEEEYLARLSPQPETDDGYDDNDTQFQKDIQKALLLSVKESARKEHQAYGGESSTSGPSSGGAQQGDSVIVDDLDDYDRQAGTLRFSDKASTTNETPIAEVVNYESWGDFDPTSQPFFGSQPFAKPAPVHYAPRNNYNATRSPRKSFTNVARSSQAPSPSHSAPPVVAHTSSTSSSAKPPVAPAPAPATTTAGFGSKPSKEKYASEFQSRVTAGDQGGSFTWSQDAVNGVGAASWASFANTTGKKWENGIDTELTDFEKEEAKRKAAAAATGSTSFVKKEGIKFNTTAGVVAGHRAQDPLNQNGDEDNWSKEEERPDTMEMKMNQIPIRKHFSGPRTMGPGDADSDDDDDDDDDDDEDGNPRQKAVDGLQTFVDAIYPESFEQNQELAMLTLESFEHLDMIIVPDEPFTVTVCFHTVESKSQRFVLKALQLYLSTGESYTCVLEKACQIRDRPRFKSTVFGRLLSDPSIKRISWYPEYIKDSFEQVLGFEMGPTVDLALKVMENDKPMPFAEAVDKYLEDWPDLRTYFELKEHYENSTNISGKKFGGSCWERTKLPEQVLQFCAIQGLTAYTLYQKTLELGFGDDEDYIYPDNDDE